MGMDIYLSQFVPRHRTGSILQEIPTFYTLPVNDSRFGYTAHHHRDTMCLPFWLYCSKELRQTWDDLLLLPANARFSSIVPTLSPQTNPYIREGKEGWHLLIALRINLLALFDQIPGSEVPFYIVEYIGQKPYIHFAKVFQRYHLFLSWMSSRLFSSGSESHQVSRYFLAGLTAM